MRKEILIRYLDNKCTEREVEEVFLWIKNNALNKDSIRWALERWNWSQIKVDEIMDDEEFLHLFDKIQNKIDIDSLEKEKPKGRVLWSTRLTKVAAVLFFQVLFMSGYLLFWQRPDVTDSIVSAIDSVEVVSPFFSKTRVLLSDGSEVFLNSGSKLKYPQQFSGQTRNVILVGEGYFNVSTNPEKPFLVQAGSLSIKAVGTSFNVLAYSEKETIETTLVHGKVMIERIAPDGTVQTLSSMLPNQHVKYDVKTGTIYRNSGNMEKYIAWRDGKLIFEDTPICEVAERLNQMFNVQIEVNSNIKDYILTVTFENEPLSRILELMSKAIPELRYKVMPQKKLPDDTYSKQRIIIEKNNLNV